MGKAGIAESIGSPARVLIGIFVLALAVRLYGIGSSSLWLDEFCSIETATGRGLAHVALPMDRVIQAPPRLTAMAGARPWWAIWTTMGLDNHPPLYFLLLRFLMDVFGTSDVAVRAFSIVPSLAGIWFFYIAVKEQSDTTAALWAATLMAVAMPQIHYGQEARGV